MDTDRYRYDTDRWHRCANVQVIESMDTDRDDTERWHRCANLLQSDKNTWIMTLEATHPDSHTHLMRKDQTQCGTLPVFLLCHVCVSTHMFFKLRIIVLGTQ